MFGSRRHSRPPNPPLTTATVDPNAATAAAAVFKRHESSPSLSAAAAAAALRARPMTPTRVADVQTRRTMRRSASIASSSRTSSPIQGRPTLQRRGSSGSMTERTFRSPSPHRPTSSGSGHHQSQPIGHDAPPVPALPKDIDSPSLQQKNSNTLNVRTTPVRLASQRLAADDGPSWFSAAKLGDPNNVRRTDPAMASPPSSPPQILHAEDEPVEGARPDSRASSINFSYPTRTRVGSSPVSPTDAHTSVRSPPRTSASQAPVAAAQAQRARHQSSRQSSTAAAPRTRSTSSSSEALVYDPNSRRMVRQADLEGVQHTVIEASQQRAGSKRKKKTPQRAGSHLAAGSVGRTKSAVTNDNQPAPNQAKAAVLQLQEQTPVLMQPPRELQEERDEPVVKAIISSPRIEARKPRAQEAAQPVETPASPLSIPAPVSREPIWQTVRRQPSMVKEEPEPEETATEPRPKASLSKAALDAVPTRQKVYMTTDLEAKPDAALKHTGAQSAAPNPTVKDSRRHNQVSQTRSHSNSPARQAHFGQVQENLTVKHSPPPRSISPRKSALKHTSPSRGASPSDDTSEASGSVNHELPLGRKKSARVSFDDEGSKVVTGDHAAAQDNNRHRWFSNHSSINKDMPPLDDDEIMKPRPALPSFGSVRDKKPRDASPEEIERPLVRPKGETPYSSGGSIGPALLPSPPLGLSNDHAIGGIFSSGLEESFQHAANTSRLREPLPPVVTSVEGNGYVSDSSISTTSLSEFEQPEIFGSVPAQEQQRAAAPQLTISLPKLSVNGSAIANTAPVAEIVEKDTEPEALIPVISISEPTPPPLVENKVLKPFFVVPGGFPEDESDRSASSASRLLATTADLAKTANSSLEKSQATSSPVHTIAPPTTDSSGDSDSSIYSDAYEDLSDMDGNGFMSLDAVVDSPLRSAPPANPLSRQASTENPPAQRSASDGPKLQTELSTATTVVGLPPVENTEDEWEKAKVYWRSLTAEKRALLEKEAAEDAGIEGDLEEIKNEPKPKKKKSLERRDSERKALALHMAQQMMAQQQKQNALHAKRTYQIKPGTKWADEDVVVPTMRRTMRNEPQDQQPAVPAVSEGPKLRKSMRANGSGPKGSEPRVLEPRTTAQRPLSTSSAAAASATINHRQVAAQSSSGPATGLAGLRSSALKRRDSSGSESSFKRSRARGAREQGVGFRMSMRATSPPTIQTDARSSKRFSLRALSPTGSSPKQQAESPAVGAQMRRTLRGSSTGRKSPTGMHMPSFGKKGGAKASSRKSSSRFADSSDEDVGGSAIGFQSRFDDSSDDEPIVPMPVTLPTSHSAPVATTLGRSHRNQGSVASTALVEELEESEEAQDTPTNCTTKQPVSPQPEPGAHPPLSLDTSLRRTRSGRGSILSGSQTAPALGASTMSTSPAGAFPSLANDSKRHSTTSRRNSLMSVLRRKKHDTSGGISKHGITESPARRDTKLERSLGQLKGIRDEEEPSPVNEEAEIKIEEQVQTPPPSAPAPKSPKLQKRIGLIQHDSREGGEELRRPSTSGNIGTRTLSGGIQQQVSRRTYSTGVPSVDGSVIGTPTKKKRFGVLRRMFKLDD